MDEMEEGCNCYWVILSNSGGELERAAARTGQAARDKAVEMLSNCPYVSDGDKISIEMGWTEQFE